MKKMKRFHPIDMDTESNIVKNSDVLDLPDEILVKIFYFYLRTETNADLLQNVAQVCEQWKNVAMDRTLWCSVDNSLTKTKLLELCKNGYLKDTESLNLSNLGMKLTSNNFINIFKTCPNLKSIDLSNATEIAANTLNLLPIHCPHLTKLSISDVSLGGHIKGIGPRHINILLKLCGEHLSYLNFSHNHFVHFTVIMIEIAHACPNLKELNVTCLAQTSKVFPLQLFQSNCQKLEILKMGPELNFSKDTKKQSPCSGFQNLKEFSFVTNDELYQGPTNEELFQILKDSRSLKYLNITGCQRINSDVISVLPATDMECLILSKSDVCRNCYFDKLMIEKWCHSLKQLNISRAFAQPKDGTILFGNSCKSQLVLEILDVSCTDIEASEVKELLERCPNMKEINLKSCLKFNREMAHPYCGEKEISLLRQLLDEQCEIQS